MNTRLFVLRCASLILKAMSFLLNHAALLLLLAFVLSPISPHLLWEYEYREIGRERVTTRCTYLGSRGFVTPDMRGVCPSIMILNANDFSHQP